MQEVRWGMIGVGEVVRLKSGPAFATAPGSRVVAVCARTPGKARQYAAETGVEGWHERAEDLIADPLVNAVYVATPPASHADLAIAAVRAGKAVYIEKPMATTHAECLRIIAAAGGAPIHVAYYRRALPKFLKLRELVFSGAIGEVRCVSIAGFYPPRAVDLDTQNPPWRVFESIAGVGGYFIDMIPHQLDILDFILGPIAEAAGRRANRSGLYPADDTFCAEFHFESGALGAGTWCFTAEKSTAADRTEIIGSLGSLVFSTFDWGPFILKTATGEKSFDFPVPAVIQQPMVEAVVASLLGRGDSPCDAATAARTNRVIDSILGIA